MTQKFKHTETNTQRITTIDIESEEKANRIKAQYEKQGIKVTVKDESGEELEFYALGFITIPDPAGDPIFHIKFKKGLVLYITTPHPDALKCLDDLRLLVTKLAPQPTEVRDFMIDIKETIAATQKGEMIDGVHPEMGYVETHNEG